MYHIYMPVEMVLLMTKNRHFLNKELVAKPPALVPKNEVSHEYNDVSNIIEMYKCL
jgi:hypothetical protein